MKKHLPLAMSIIFAAPAIANAQSPSFQNLLTNILSFINDSLIPFLFGIAFVVFVINVIRFFVAGADNKDAQESAKSVATYSVGAFVFLVIFWGIVNLLVSSTGVGPANCTQPVSDYYDGPTPPDCW